MSKGSGRRPEAKAGAYASNFDRLDWKNDATGGAAEFSDFETRLISSLEQAVQISRGEIPAPKITTLTRNEDGCETRVEKTNAFLEGDDDTIDVLDCGPMSYAGLADRLEAERKHYAPNTIPAPALEGDEAAF